MKRIPIDDGYSLTDEEITIPSSADIEANEQIRLVSSSPQPLAASHRSFPLQVQAIVVPADPWRSIHKQRSRQRRCRICGSALLVMVVLASAAFVVEEMASQKRPGQLVDVVYANHNHSSTVFADIDAEMGTNRSENSSTTADEKTLRGKGSEVGSSSTHTYGSKDESIEQEDDDNILAYSDDELEEDDEEETTEPSSIKRIQYKCPASSGGSDRLLLDDAINSSNSDSKNYDLPYAAQTHAPGYDFLPYNKTKEALREYVVQQFIPPLRNGGTVFMHSCGDGASLLMHLELFVENGITNMEIYGSTTHGASTDDANQLMTVSQQHAPKGMTIHEMCSVESIMISYVPSDSFDLVFTSYIEPLLDPLGINGAPSIHNDYPLTKSFARCASTDPSEMFLAKQEQRAQEDWFAAYAGELIRIAKPGGTVIVENVSKPLCDVLEDRGGVSQGWWSEAAKKNNWDIDVDSIAFDAALSGSSQKSTGQRYNVSFLKKERTGIQV